MNGFYDTNAAIVALDDSNPALSERDGAAQLQPPNGSGNRRHYSTGMI
jgi:hypothetical protein